MDIVLALAAVVIAFVTIGLWFWSTAPGTAVYGGRLQTWGALNRSMVTRVLPPGADPDIWTRLLHRQQWMTISMMLFFVVFGLNEIYDAFNRTGWRMWLAGALAVLFFVLAGFTAKRLRAGSALQAQL
ncbi:hypothetical protein [Antrihabitans sp. YC2-6]|uniref:hypothetical protein n=1 Tax=Antrihabitans sp. YC2-6 TaxID=2799498 RepID=UPI0018F60777|nr:hypothetical protein [Antrihabitans sp. YC2-6]MBJ8347802.1 hypothetical protein [Antrihabitans sp. YC2-6]